MATIALHQAGYISGATKSNWMAVTTPALASRFGWIDQYRALQHESNRRRAPQRLLARAIVGYQEGVVSVQTLATLRGADADAVEAELRDAGIEPGESIAAWSDGSDLPEADVDLTELDDLADRSSEASVQ
jgi:hypothetical protein